MTHRGFHRLLAKSPPGLLNGRAEWPQSILLSSHLREAFSATQQVLAATRAAQLDALQLDPGAWLERLERAVLLAAALHDLGKANDHFQGMIQGTPERRGRPQGLRHEWVTALIMHDLRDWLRRAVANEIDLRIVRWAVAGHHPAYGRESPPRTLPDGGGSEMMLLLDHPDYLECLDWIAGTFSLSAPPKSGLDGRLPLVGSGNAFARLAAIHQDDSRAWRSLCGDGRDAEGPMPRFVACVKNSLIAGDVAGSALPREVADAAERVVWIPSAFHRIPTPEHIAAIIGDRLTDQETGQARPLRPFQRAVAEQAAEVTLVKAGCGTGKTLAAYHWGRTCHPGKRLYLCYPTTGTATEGFRDYLVSGESPRFDADLFHGRANADLEMLGVRRGGDESDDEGMARIESLDAWSTPIVCCTADTVLGLVQNNRRGLFAWPALAGAAIVFDEIHAYDDRLFGALLRFLSVLRGVPVLLMTASLPAFRFEALRTCLGRSGRAFGIVPGPEDIESLPRYHRLTAQNADDPLPEVRDGLDAGGKVLWVCNTVDRAISVAEGAADLEPIIYHSRFRYVDRVQRHKELVERFRAAGPALAICTQVAEMSLDLSATLLVTDLAPVPALIQRLGRLNRRAAKGAPTRPFVVVEPKRQDGSAFTLPYSPEEFDLARRWLEAVKRLGHGAVTQRHLVDAWEQIPEVQRRRPAVVAIAWLDGGPTTQVLELREASPGITVLLEEDAAGLCPKGRESRRRIAELTLPMPPPKHLNWREWHAVSGIPVAPKGTIDYNERRGARWLPNV